MTYIDGDLLKLAAQGKFDVIGHGCNCFHTMGAGVALQVRRVYDGAYKADLRTPRGDAAKLGTCSHWTNGKLTVVNCYTQYNLGHGAADYAAIASCMRWLAKHYAGKRIGLPKIGAGLAGGDWPIIEDIIERELVPHADVTIVNFVP